MTPMRPPRGVMATALAGLLGGALGWVLALGLTAITLTRGRSDQLAALVLGASIGACVLGARALRVRRPIVIDGAVGALIGGASAMIAPSIPLLLEGGYSVRSFLPQRLLVWALSGAASATLLATYNALFAPGRIGESALIGAIGGVGAAMIVSLPGPADLTHALGYLWFGFSIGVAVAGPELWRTVAVITILPRRGREWSLWQLREILIHDNSRNTFGTAQLVCLDRRVMLFPPAGGVTADGRRVRRARYLIEDTLLGVGRLRGEYRMQSR